MTSGLRVGTPAVTSRGFGHDEMVSIAGFIDTVLHDFEQNRDAITAQVISLCEKFPIYEG